MFLPGKLLILLRLVLVWNRLDSSTGDTRVDYEKLDADLKQA